MRYSNFVFDLYGTLMDIRTDEEDPDFWVTVAKFYEKNDASYGPEEIRLAYRTYVENLEAEMGKTCDYPEIDIAQVFEKLYRDKGIEPGRDLIVETAEFFRKESRRFFRLYEGTIDMLKSLKAAGGKVYLLSNAQSLFTVPELKESGLYPCFDDILISSDYGVRKPDQKFYGELLKKHNLNPVETIMTGNDGENDIRAAKRAGLSTCYVHTEISPKEPLPGADYEFAAMDMEKIKEALLS